MPNVNTPFGLAPHSYLNGAAWNGQARMYYIDSGDANAYAIGDPVAPQGSADANGVMRAVLATAGTGNAFCGCIVGTSSGPYGSVNMAANPNTTIIPATKTQAYYILVADDPNIIFEIQEGGGGAALTVADVGSNANLLSGTNNGYSSGWTFNNATLATTATLQLRLLGLTQRLGNGFGAYAKWLVKINNHSYAAGVAGV